MKIGIGIDTGGTFTDAVAYDFETEKLLAKGKAFTTREDLSVGIGQALDSLPQEYIRDALLVSLSTTLATNACLEGKGGRAKLLVFGLTDELAERWKTDAGYGWKKNSVRYVDTNGSADGLILPDLDWDEILAEHSAWLADADALSTAELYSMNNGAPNEKRLKKISEGQFKLPCVCASEFTSELNVLVRGATALLNARMFPIVKEFVDTAVSGFAARQCMAPVMVVRSDGSIMSSGFSCARPVETILSGPAASVLAGKHFCDKQDYIIVDMGGTTTDISVVRGGQPVMAKEGVKLAGWRTAVKGVKVSPSALGGDSTIRLKYGKPQLFPRRATPICVAAQRWPEIKDMLSELIEKNHVNLFPLHEVFYLVREPAEQKSYDKNEQALISLLRKGPCMLENLRAEAGIDLYHLNSDRLEEEGVVMRCGLTPTDFMHIKGDFTKYDAEASELAARYLLSCLEREDSREEIQKLADEVYDLVEGRLFENLLRVMLEQQYPSSFKNGIDSQTGFLLKEAWAKRDSKSTELLRHTFGTDAALVGVGAPTHVFLPAVARAIGAECIIPDNAEVANAIGSLKAGINVVARVEISQRMSPSHGHHYIVHAPAGSRSFGNLEKALAYAGDAAENAVLKEARSRGATGELIANTHVENLNVVCKQGTDVNLGYFVISEVAMRL